MNDDNSKDLQFCLERDRLLASDEFARSALMSRLLVYLIDQQLNGDDEITIEMIAAEALGKESKNGNDAAAYARLQIGRLRQVMESFYAKCSGTSRLYLPNRQYRLELIPVGAKPATFETPDSKHEGNAEIVGKSNAKQQSQTVSSSSEDENQPKQVLPLKNRIKKYHLVAIALVLILVIYVFVR